MCRPKIGSRCVRSKIMRVIIEGLERATIPEFNYPRFSMTDEASSINDDNTDSLAKSIAKAKKAVNELDDVICSSNVDVNTEELIIPISQALTSIVIDMEGGIDGERLQRMSLQLGKISNKLLEISISRAEITADSIEAKILRSMVFALLTELLLTSKDSATKPD